LQPLPNVKATYLLILHFVFFLVQSISFRFVCIFLPYLEIAEQTKNMQPGYEGEKKQKGFTLPF